MGLSLLACSERRPQPETRPGPVSPREELARQTGNTLGENFTPCPNFDSIITMAMSFFRLLLLKFGCFLTVVISSLCW